MSIRNAAQPPCKLFPGLSMSDFFRLDIVSDFFQTTTTEAAEPSSTVTSHTTRVSVRLASSALGMIDASVMTTRLLTNDPNSSGLVKTWYIRVSSCCFNSGDTLPLMRLLTSFLLTGMDIVMELAISYRNRGRIVEGRKPMQGGMK